MGIEPINYQVKSSEDIACGYNSCDCGTKLSYCQLPSYVHRRATYLSPLWHDIAYLCGKCRKTPTNLTNFHATTECYLHLNTQKCLNVK